MPGDDSCATDEMRRVCTVTPVRDEQINEAEPSLLPIRMSMEVMCGCFFMMVSRTTSSFARSRPAMAQRTGSEAAALAGSGPPGV